MTSDDLRDTAKDTAAAAGESAEGAREAAGDIASQAKAAAQTTYDKAKDGVAGLREQMPGSAGEAVDAGRRAYVQGSERLGRQVARQPIEALLLAGAIGYLVGWAANRS